MAVFPLNLMGGGDGGGGGIGLGQLQGLPMVQLQGLPLANSASAGLPSSLLGDGYLAQTQQHLAPQFSHQQQYGHQQQQQQQQQQQVPIGIVDLGQGQYGVLMGDAATQQQQQQQQQGHSHRTSPMGSGDHSMHGSRS